MNLTPAELLACWADLGGYYSCPTGADGRPTGRLVGYAGKYDDGGTDRQYVGLEYFNFGEVEASHTQLDLFAAVVAGKLADKADCVCGVPLGGMLIGQRVAAELDVPYIYAEKKVISVATADQREVSELVFGRHTPKPGTRVVSAEDVVNNASSAAKMKRLIAQAGAEMVGLACALNRSPNPVVEIDGTPLSLVAAIHRPTAQYRQDDPFVAQAIAEGRVVWKPKDIWDELMAEMRAAV